MADYNYMNASGMAPRVGFVPEGFLGGALYRDREMDYRRAIEDATVLQRIGMAKSQAELQNYIADNPVREAKRGLDIATHTAMTPIQGRLAAAKGAEADATVLTAPSDAQHKIFQNKQKERDYKEGLISNHLYAVLEQFKDNPTQGMLTWRDQVVPQLEQALGEPVPQQFRNMTYPQMRQMLQALTTSAEHRRGMEAQAAKDEEAFRRTKYDADARVAAANIKGDATNAAGVRQAAMEAYIEAKVRQGVPRDRAMIEAYEIGYGGGIPQRGAEARDNADATSNRRRLDMEKLQADSRGIVPPAQRENGVLYRVMDKQGRTVYGRWDGKGLVPVD